VASDVSWLEFRFDPGRSGTAAFNYYSFYGSIVSGHSGTGDGSVTFQVSPQNYSTSVTIEVRGLSGDNPPGIHTVALQ
jgi:hypothetical protein